MNKISLEKAYSRIQKDSLFSFLYENGDIIPVYDSDSPWGNLDIHLLPGSFNPLHIAHETIFSSIEQNNTIFKSFEISIERIDKEFLDIDSLKERLMQFDSKGPILVNRWPYFIQKAGLLRNWNIMFHIGIDTAIRLVEAHGIAGIQGIAAQFTVYDRIVDNRKLGLNNSLIFSNRIPVNFHQGKNNNETLLGLSSTDIRLGLKDKNGNIINQN